MPRFISPDKTEAFNTDDADLGRFLDLDDVKQDLLADGWVESDEPLIQREGTVCVKCNGSGRVKKEDEFMFLKEACSVCNGTGRIT